MSKIYRCLDVDIWNHPKVIPLAQEIPSPREVFFHIIVNRFTNPTGLYYAGKAMLAENIRTSPKGYAEPFAKALETGLFEYDEELRIVWVPDFLERHQPANPNNVKGFRKHIERLPKGFNLLNKWLEHTPKVLEKLELDKKEKKLVDAFYKTFPNPLKTVPEGLPEPDSNTGNREQGTENREQETPPTPSPQTGTGKIAGAGKREGTPVEEQLAREFNKIFDGLLDPVTIPLSPERTAHVRARMRGRSGRSDVFNWIEFFQRLTQHDYQMGRVKNWKLKFDDIMHSDEKLDPLWEWRPEKNNGKGAPVGRTYEALT